MSLFGPYLKKGKLANVVIVQGNPLEDIEILGYKDHVKVVFKNGVLEKGEQLL
jgi:imidazolonepropionase-like amidohydrolase